MCLSIDKLFVFIILTSHDIRVFINCVFQAYDQHLNLVLGDVEETITVIEIDDETYEEIYKTTRRNIPMLYVRGDGVTLIAPPTKMPQ